MSTAPELGTLIYVAALQMVPRGGGIAEVSREGASVLIYGRQPGGLRGVYHEPTCVQALVTDQVVRGIVLGGRPGIPQGEDLFTLPVAGRPLAEVADDAVARISEYLAATTS